MKRSVTVLLFDDVEVLDFAGPLDVFLLANEHGDGALFDVRTTARHRAPVVAAYRGLSINPSCSIADVRSTDVLVVPGGNDISATLGDDAVLRWVREMSATADVVLSVCSGALILAKAGLLTGLAATTHHTDLQELAALAPDATVKDDTRFTDNGKIVTSAGITAGIDASLHVVDRLCGPAIARLTASSLEYTPQ